jgi:dihydrofolate reductase
MSLSIIVAVSSNGVIGSNGDMPWHISEDLKRFKKLTLGSKIIMGRKTWESLPFRPLKKRENMVISRNKNYQAAGAVLVNSLEEALQTLNQDEEAFIIGGGQIYNQAMNFADKLYITEIHADFEGDTSFPEIKQDEWTEQERIENFDKEEQIHYSFVSYHRKNKN